MNIKYTFSGHESFPCKSLWLKKGYDFVNHERNFNAPDAVIDLGVGKNMVSSIRFWLKSFGLYDGEHLSELADYLFDEVAGRDKYMEDLATLWLLHFTIVTSGEATLYDWLFKGLQKERKEFDRAQVLSYVKRRLLEDNKYSLFNENTVKKDIGVLLLNYIKLRDVWTIASIKRVYRYVIDLFQPNYLSDRTASDSDDVYFKTNFYKQDANDLFCEPIFNEQISIFDKALATFEGYIDKEHIGHVSIKSESLELDDVIDIVGNDNQVYIKLSDVHFKIYYFIYNRPLYYGDRITNQELNSIQSLSLTASGVRLYRNGFRVLPYGEATDDWTKVDRRWSSDSGVINVPLSNKNLFGFVEIQDPTGMLFEETSSREGLIENEAFNELSDFVHKSLVAARQRLASALTRFKKRRNADVLENDTEKESSINEKLDFLDKMINDSVANLNSDNQIDRNKRFYEGKQIVHELRGQLEELSMLRVLAGLGLSIGEFTHEIKQYRPSIYGQIHQLLLMSLPEEAINRVNKIKYNFDNLFVYTDYFRKTITQNLDRRVESIDILEVIDDFRRIIEKDADQFGIKFDIVARSFDVTIIPMHRSEWSSILYNLYSNAKKAIVRAKRDIGTIRIVVGSLNDDTVVIDFEDNGDGIPLKNWERVFEAFFTTTSPASFDAPTDEQMVGTGLGLKIVKDIIVYYKGKIYLVPPEENFSTCFRIELPKQ